MSPVLSLALAMTFPFALLGMILWLCRLEEGLPEDIRRTRHTPDPEPILRIPVRARPLLHQELLVEAGLGSRPDPLEQHAARAQAAPPPAVPLDVDVPPQRTPEDQVPTGTR